MEIFNIKQSLFNFSKNTFKSYSVFVFIILFCFFLPTSMMIDTQLAGYTNVSASVSENGGATASIDINVPKGTFVQPKLTLSYNSQNGNGLQGLGVNLSGVFQAITRIPSTKAQDGASSGVKLDASDRYALNGERLIVIKGIYGADGSEYRTEQNTFIKIIAYGSTGFGVDKFKVWTKDGLVLDFAFTSDSKIEASGTTNRVMAWLLNKIEDTNGNYLTVQYAEDNNNGTFYPLTINYSGNSKTGLQPYNKVVFTYENRSDVITKYIGGFKTTSIYRLSGITAYDHSAVFRRYALTYTGYSGSSKLARVTEYGSDNSSYLRSVDFTWSVPLQANYNFNKTGTGFWTAHGGGYQNNVVADFNGDGRSDLAAYNSTYNGGSWHVCLSTGTSFGQAMWGGHKGGISNNAVGDFNGDGKADLISYAGNNQWTVSISTGSSFTNYTWIGHSGGMANNIVGDFDGDGRSDLATYNASYNGGTWQICLSTGTGFVTTYWAGGHKFGLGGTVAADFNGDGKTDLAAFTGGRQGWEVSLSTGNSFTNSLWNGPWAAKNNAFVGDFNGDGMADFASYADATNGIWAINLSTGTGFIQYGWAGHKGSERNNIVGDFNGDGLTDLAGYAGNGTWHVSMSTGSSFSSPYYWQGHAGGTSNNVIGDFNGDGLTDLGGYAGFTGTDGSWHITLSNAAKEFVSTVTNGNGIAYNFEYQPLTQSNTYTKGVDAIYPSVDITGALYVVKKFTTANGVGGNRSIDYTYSGAKYDNSGRGFRGFTQTTSTDLTANMRVITTYSLDYRSIAARVIRQETRAVSNNRLMSLTENEITYVDQGGKVFFSYYSKTTTRSYDFNSGAELSNIVTTNQYDSYGNPTLITQKYTNGYTITTTNTYSNTEGNWYLGRLNLAKVAKNASGKATITKTSRFEYDANGNLFKEILLPENSALSVTNLYTIDKYGNRVSATTSGADFQTRSTSVTFDAEGRYALAETNALGHKVSKIYINGLLTSITDADGLTSTMAYDPFGRILRKNFPDGTWETTSYSNCSSNCPADAITYIETKASGRGVSGSYHDRLDRNIRKETEGWGGVKLYVDTKFNADGTVNAISEPYGSGITPVWTTYGYDAIKRKTSETAPGGRTTTISLNGLTTIITNPEGQRTVSTVNAQGQVISTTDNLGNIITNDFDSDGNPIALKYSNRQITNTYNIRGFKAAMKDPDMGNFAYVTNGLGLVMQQTNNKGEITKYTYDILDRVTRREEPEGITEFRYDPVNGKGQISQIWLNGKFSEGYEYNGFGKVVKATYSRNNQNKTFEYTYNINGLMETLKYPDATTVKNIYDTRGFLTEVRNNTTNALYWRADFYNQYGEPVTFSLGNGLITKQTYDSNTNDLKAIKTGTSANPTSIQDLAIEYNRLGNVISRADNKFNLKETFEYDVINRLNKVYLFRNNQKVNTLTKTLEYDAYGNITYKSDVGRYSYGENGATPNALTSINTAGVSNCIYPFNQTSTFTSYNYVSVISNSNTKISFTYGGNRDRQYMTVEKNGLVKQRKTYVGGLYEETTNNLGQLTTVCYIKAGGSIVAYVSKTGSEAQKATYIHTDHLGSVYALTDAAGQVQQRYSYDAWGKSRNALTWDDSPDFMTLPLFQRGFTFHESLDIDGLICMNARVYSPILGRFLSPDSFVQFPNDFQSLNRYAYTFNNPLTLTDPSGHASLGKLLKDNIGAIVGIGIAIATGGAGSFLVSALGTFWGAVASGAAAGFGAAFTQGVVNGGSIGDAFKSGLQGAAWGAVSAGLTFQIAHGTDFFSPERLTANKELYVVKGIMHGIAQGGIAEARGGEFRQGFASAVFSEIALDGADGLGLGGGSQILVGTIVGGTSSVISGGKFANGALTGAFIAIYNHGAEVDWVDVGITVLDVATFVPIFWELKPLVWGLRGAVTAYRAASYIEKGAHAVYVGLNAAGEVKYIGRSVNVAERWYQHQAASGTGRELLRYQIVEGGTNLSLNSARVLEQNLINQFGGVKGGQLLNKINSVAPKYWKDFGIK